MTTESAQTSSLAAALVASAHSASATSTSSTRTNNTGSGTSSSSSSSTLSSTVGNTTSSAASSSSSSSVSSAAATGMQQPHEKIYELTYRGEKKPYQCEKIADDGNCGLSVLDLKRDEACELLHLSKEEEVFNLIGMEIYGKTVEGYKHLPQSMWHLFDEKSEYHHINTQVANNTERDKQLKTYCAQIFIVRLYIHNYLEGGGWATQAFLSALAHIKKLKLIVYRDPNPRLGENSIQFYFEYPSQDSKEEKAVAKTITIYCTHLVDNQYTHYDRFMPVTIAPAPTALPAKASDGKTSKDDKGLKDSSTADARQHYDLALTYHTISSENDLDTDSKEMMEVIQSGIEAVEKAIQHDQKFATAHELHAQLLFLSAQQNKSIGPNNAKSLALKARTALQTAKSLSSGLKFPDITDALYVFTDGLNQAEYGTAPPESQYNPTDEGAIAFAQTSGEKRSARTAFGENGLPPAKKIYDEKMLLKYTIDELQSFRDDLLETRANYQDSIDNGDDGDDFENVYGIERCNKKIKDIDMELAKRASKDAKHADTSAAASTTTSTASSSATAAPHAGLSAVAAAAAAAAPQPAAPKPSPKPPSPA